MAKNVSRHSPYYTRGSLAYAPDRRRVYEYDRRGERDVRRGRYGRARRAVGGGYERRRAACRGRMTSVRPSGAPGARQARVTRVRRKPPVQVIPVVVARERMFRLSKLTIVTIALIFAGLLGFALPSAMIYNVDAKTAALRSELEKINETNTQLAVDISKTYDLDQIRRLATAKLGMTEPAPYQKIDIYVPRASHTIEYQQPENQRPADRPSDDSILKGVGDMFNFVKNSVSGLLTGKTS